MSDAARTVDFSSLLPSECHAEEAQPRPPKDRCLITLDKIYSYQPIVAGAKHTGNTRKAATDADQIRNTDRAELLVLYVPQTTSHV